jgi:ATP-binding cassette subfamily F protein 3
VQPFDGDLDDYQRWLLEVSRAAQRGTPPPPLPSLLDAAPPAAAAAKPVSPPPPAARDDRQSAKQARVRLAERTRPLRYEIKQIDERLAQLATEKAEVEALLAQPALDPAAYADHGRRHAHVQAEIARLEERWLETQAALEAIEAG